MQLDITSNMKAFQKQMFINERQVPFATSKAINETLFKNVAPYNKMRTFPSAFANTSRARGMVNKRTFQIVRANKRRLIGIYQTTGKTDYLQEQHVEGKTRRPHTAKYMLTPMIIRGRVSKTKRHKEHSPSELLKKPDFFFGEIKGVKGIWQRKTGRDGGKFVWLWYTATPSQDFSNRRGSLDFYEDALRVSERAFGAHFTNEYRKAIRTAR